MILDEPTTLEEMRERDRAVRERLGLPIPGAPAIVRLGSVGLSIPPRPAARSDGAIPAEEASPPPPKPRGLRCPSCAAVTATVTDSRVVGSVVRRRRECESCQYRWNTVEIAVADLPIDIEQLRAGFRAIIGDLVRATDGLGELMERVSDVGSDP